MYTRIYALTYIYIYLLYIVDEPHAFNRISRWKWSIPSPIFQYREISSYTVPVPIARGDCGHRYIHIHIHTYICIHMYIYIHTHIYAYKCICMCMYIYVYIYICIYKYIYICTRVHIIRVKARSSNPSTLLHIPSRPRSFHSSLYFSHSSSRSSSSANFFFPLFLIPSFRSFYVYIYSLFIRTVFFCSLTNEPPVRYRFLR